MGEKSGIAWTDATWNPVTGCTKVSEGCLNCYAEIQAKKLQFWGSKRYVNGFKVTTHKDVLNLPLRWKEPKKIFVNSMSDLFHKDVPDSFIDGVMGVIVLAHWHTFQILTKRPERMAGYFITRPVPKNCWIGTTVENARVKYRIDSIRFILGPVRFISFEPLIGEVGSLNLSGIDWVIIGGESGVNHRPMDEMWAMSVMTQAKAQSIPVYFKQWGGVRPKSNGDVFRGSQYHEFPKVV